MPLSASWWRLNHAHFFLSTSQAPCLLHVPRQCRIQAADTNKFPGFYALSAAGRQRFHYSITSSGGSGSVPGMQSPHYLPTPVSGSAYSPFHSFLQILVLRPLIPIHTRNHQPRACLFFSSSLVQGSHNMLEPFTVSIIANAMQQNRQAATHRIAMDWHATGLLRTPDFGAEPLTPSAFASLSFHHHHHHHH